MCLMTYQRILATVSREDFVGRDAELQQIVAHASARGEKRALLLLATPRSGSSELLRQAYDHLFTRRGEAIPILLAFNYADGLIESAHRVFQSLIQQYIAYRRVDPSLCRAPLGLQELVELALPGDYELISTLVENFDRRRADCEGRELLQFSVSASQRLSSAGRSVFPLVDVSELAVTDEGHPGVAEEVAGALARSGTGFALAGLRRHVLNLVHASGDGNEHELIHIEKLSDDDARTLIERAAQRLEVESNEPTRDLLVQELGASPFLMTALLEGARETKTALTSFLNCQRLYVDEVFGGRINRHFSAILDNVAPPSQVRKNLLRVLYESAASGVHKSSLWAWKKRLGVDASQFERIIDALHVHELANSSAAFIEVSADAYVWMDYLRAQYRLEVAGEPRALVVATTLLETLKRAPQAMARSYRREAALGLRQLLENFNCQQVPASLFQYESFAAGHKGLDAENANAALDAESDLIRLPQIVHATGCAAFSASVDWDDERSAVGHGFDAAEYNAENEIVWLTAELDSRAEATREVTAAWCDRLSALARECKFGRVRLWLVAPEGFTPEASELLEERDAYGSSHRQVELLTSRVRAVAGAGPREGRADEFEMVIPMSPDTELIAAHAVEQIARRVKFPPEAINQIKTALVEACINAAEHSLSPDRKIYQRFRVENDKLVITVASRGVVPVNLAQQNGQDQKREDGATPMTRRGWGLKLIQTLMDEVEFERVDDGTQLRMTKYKRK